LTRRAASNSATLSACSISWAGAGPGIAACVRLRAALAEDDDAAAIESLRQIAATLRVVRSILDRMTESCDPYIYYRRVRPFIFG
jgi:indoleamine 2,3-dioxygenase